MVLSRIVLNMVLNRIVLNTVLNRNVLNMVFIRINELHLKLQSRRSCSHVGFSFDNVVNFVY
jgi:hypothetical protein